MSTARFVFVASLLDELAQLPELNSVVLHSVATLLALTPADRFRALAFVCQMLDVELHASHRPCVDVADAGATAPVHRFCLICSEYCTACGRSECAAAERHRALRELDS